MKIMKIAIALAAAALMTSPAWALPGHGGPNTGGEHGPNMVPMGPPSTTPNYANNPGSAHRSAKGQEHAGGGEHAAGREHGGASNGSGNAGADHGAARNVTAQTSHPGRSHRCTPHKIAYVASGTLLGQTLTKDTGANTYSGTVEVAVKHTNHHAAHDRNTTQKYPVEHVRVTFALSDINNDGSVGLDDVQTNDRVRVIGKISSLARKCDHSGFSATLAIKHIVLHPPAHS